MRLRSSQFVFLLLLVCSVQTRESFALHLMAGAAFEPASTEMQPCETQSTTARQNLPAGSPTVRPVPERHLDAASVAAEKTPWSMRRPALASAAVSSFTGFLRA